MTRARDADARRSASLRYNRKTSEQRLESSDSRGSQRAAAPAAERRWTVQATARDASTWSVRAPRGPSWPRHRVRDLHATSTTVPVRLSDTDHGVQTTTTLHGMHAHAFGSSAQLVWGEGFASPSTDTSRKKKVLLYGAFETFLRHFRF